MIIDTKNYIDPKIKELIEKNNYLKQLGKFIKKQKKNAKSKIK